jgi:hypothetical protein
LQQLNAAALHIWVLTCRPPHLPPAFAVTAVVQGWGTAAAVLAAIVLFFLLGCQMSAFEAWTHLALVYQTLLGYGILLLAMLAWNSGVGSKLKAPRGELAVQPCCLLASQQQRAMPQHCAMGVLTCNPFPPAHSCSDGVSPG